MGKLKIVLNIILISFFLSCKSQTNNMLNESELENKLIEVALSYVKNSNKKKQNNEQLYIYIEKGNEKNNTYYKYTFYESGILNENLNLPYKYVNKQNFVLFFFDEQKKTPKNLKEHLKKDSLWVSLSNIDEFKKKKPVIVLSDSPVWDVFICKKNIQKFEVLKSPYGMNKEDKVTKMCN